MYLLFGSAFPHIFRSLRRFATLKTYTPKYPVFCIFFSCGSLFTYSPRSRSITCFPVVFSVRWRNKCIATGDILLLACLVHLYLCTLPSIGCLIDRDFLTAVFFLALSSPPARHPPVSFTLRFPTMLHSITDYLSLIKKVWRKRNRN